MTRPLISNIVVDENGDQECDCRYDENTHLVFLQGAFDANPHSAEQLQSSLDKLQQAVNASPKYARAISELAYTKVLAGTSLWFSQAETDAALVAAEALSGQAVALEPFDYTTHWSRAFYYVSIPQQMVDVNGAQKLSYDVGLEEFERAEELFKSHTDPMDRRSGLLVEYGEALVNTGDPANIQLGIEKIEKALTPPDWYLWTAAYAYYAAGDFAKAQEYLDKMKHGPGDPDYMFPSLLIIAAIGEETNNPGVAENAMVTYFQKGQESLRNHAVRNNLKPPVDAVERIFANEFERYGFRDEGETDLSRRWRTSLGNTFKRVANQLADYGFNLDLIRIDD